jgi:hypothetical protein
MFHNYRIPRENLLNRTGDINEDGEYETQFSDPQRILGMEFFSQFECLRNFIGFNISSLQ